MCGEKVRGRFKGKTVTWQGFKHALCAMGMLASAFWTVPVKAATMVSGVYANAPFVADDCTAFFTFTLANMLERALEPITARKMAVDGLKALATLEPSLSLKESPSLFEVRLGDHVMVATPPPGNNDAAGWAALTTASVLRLREGSEPIGALDNEATYQAIMAGILSNFDVHSRYSGALEAAQRRDARMGYGGIGIRYDIEPEQLTVTFVQPDTPAAAAGIRLGDGIQAIDGQWVKALQKTPKAISEALRGPPDSRSLLRMVRLAGDGLPQASDIIIHRRVITPKTVSLEPDSGDGIALIRLTGFNLYTATSLSAAITEAKTRFSGRVRGVVLDMRGNPGGLLDQAIETVDLFLNKGSIINTEGRANQANHAYVAPAFAHGGVDIADGAPLVVVVDGGSASASEIVAVALQDNERAVVVGSTTYGKGTVQSVVRLPNDGELALTWSRFHSPSGYTLQGLGVLPSVCLRKSGESASQALARSFSAEATSVALRWRSVAPNDVAGREMLRGYCPPQNEIGWASPLDVARRLIDDHEQYGRALTPTVAQAASR